MIYSLGARFGAHALLIRGGPSSEFTGGTIKNIVVRLLGNHSPRDAEARVAEVFGRD